MMLTVIRSKKIFTLIIDSALLIESFILASIIRYRDLQYLFKLKEYYWQVFIVLLFYILIFYLQGLYTLQDIRTFSKRIQKTLLSFPIAALLSILFFYFVQNPEFKPKTLFFIFNILYIFQFIAWRHIAGLRPRSEYSLLRVGFLGWDNNLMDILNNRDIKETFNMEFSVLHHDSSSVIPGLQELLGKIEICTNLSAFERLFKEKGLDIVVISPPAEGNPAVKELLFNNLRLKASYLSLAEFYEMLMARIPIDSINQMWFLEHLQFKSKAAYEKFKRIFDFIAALLFMVISLPFWPIIGLLIKANGSGPVLFKQKRCGLDREIFTIYKFRTMRNENNTGEHTGEKDHRITPFGSLLRKTRLDEIPQLINIILGQMSFIGPRPERPEFVIELKKEVPFYSQRMLVLPGLTGWDQVSGEYHSPTVKDTYKKLQYDLYYLKNRSFYLDFIIILKTISTVFSRTGR